MHATAALLFLAAAVASGPPPPLLLGRSPPPPRITSILCACLYTVHTHTYTQYIYVRVPISRILQTTGLSVYVSRLFALDSPRVAVVWPELFGFYPSSWGEKKHNRNHNNNNNIVSRYNIIYLRPIRWVGTLRVPWHNIYTHACARALCDGRIFFSFQYEQRQRIPLPNLEVSVKIKYSHRAVSVSAATNRRHTFGSDAYIIILLSRRDNGGGGSL